MTVRPTPEQIHALQEWFVLGTRRAATMLNYLCESVVVEMEVVSVEVLTPAELRSQLGDRFGNENISGMELVYNGHLEGCAQIVFSPQSSEMFVETLATERRRRLDREQIEMKTLSEVGNILFNGLMGSLMAHLDEDITYMPPFYRQGSLAEIFPPLDTNTQMMAVLGRTEVTIANEGWHEEIFIFFQVQQFGRILEGLGVIE